jgi:uncharacterized protein YxjI
VILECREDNLGFFTKMLRFTDYRRMTPFELEIRTPQGQKVITIKRGATFLRSTVEVIDDRSNVIGKFRQRLLSIGGKFDVLDPNDQLLCNLQGKILGWDFKFTSSDNKEFATVTKKWAGLGKEMFYFCG